MFTLIFFKFLKKFFFAAGNGCGSLPNDSINCLEPTRYKKTNTMHIHFIFQVKVISAMMSVFSRYENKMLNNMGLIIRMLNTNS